MKNVTLKEVEKFIKTVEEGIEQIENAIKSLDRNNGARYKYDFPVEILKRKKEQMEEELTRFRENKISNLIDLNKDAFKELLAYSNSIDNIE